MIREIFQTITIIFIIKRVLPLIVKTPFNKQPQHNKADQKQRNFWEKNPLRRSSIMKPNFCLVVECVKMCLCVAVSVQPDEHKGPLSAYTLHQTYFLCSHAHTHTHTKANTKCKDTQDCQNSLLLMLSVCFCVGVGVWVGNYNHKNLAHNTKQLCDLIHTLDVCAGSCTSPVTMVIALPFDLCSALNAPLLLWPPPPLKHRHIVHKIRSSLLLWLSVCCRCKHLR